MMASVFAVVDGVLFRPLPYPDAQDIFAVSGTFENEPAPERLVGTVSPREVAAWREGAPDRRQPVRPVVISYRLWQMQFNGAPQA